MLAAGRRGLTLLEVLAALAVVLVVSALVMPELGARLADARFEGAARQLEEAVAVSRAESQSRGVPFKLEAQTVGGRRLLVLTPLGGGADRGVSERASSGEGWVLAELPAGITIGDSSREDPEADGRSGSAAAATDAAAEPGGEDSAVRIATLMPDGAVLPAGAIRLVGKDRSGDISMNMWTGHVRLAAVMQTGQGPQGTGGEAREP